MTIDDMMPVALPLGVFSSSSEEDSDQGSPVQPQRRGGSGADSEERARKRFNAHILGSGAADGNAKKGRARFSHSAPSLSSSYSSSSLSARTRKFPASGGLSASLKRKRESQASSPSSSSGPVSDGSKRVKGHSSSSSSDAHTHTHAQPDSDEPELDGDTFNAQESEPFLAYLVDSIDDFGTDGGSAHTAHDTHNPTDMSSSSSSSSGSPPLPSSSGSSTLDSMMAVDAVTTIDSQTLSSSSSSSSFQQIAEKRRLAGEVRAYKLHVAQLQGQLGDLRERVSAKTAALETITTQHAERVQACVDLQTRLTAAETDAGQRSSELDATHATCKEQELKISTLSAQLSRDWSGLGEAEMAMLEGEFVRSLQKVMLERAKRALTKKHEEEIEALQAEIDQSVCVVCRMEPCLIIAQPCNHQVTCEECTEILKMHYARKHGSHNAAAADADVSAPAAGADAAVEGDGDGEPREDEDCTLFVCPNCRQDVKSVIRAFR